jgi:hypothetical protein
MEGGNYDSPTTDVRAVVAGDSRGSGRVLSDYCARRTSIDSGYSAGGSCSEIESLHWRNMGPELVERPGKARGKCLALDPDKRRAARGGLAALGSYRFG